MSISGISVPEDIVARYEEKRFKKEAGGIILAISDEKIIIESDADADFNKMVSGLPDSSPRFILYDVPIKNRANLDDVKTIFIFYCPLDSPVRERMLYASAKGLINSAFRGIATQIQPDDKSELTLDMVHKKINRSLGINNF